MEKAPKSLRIHIAFFGRRNAGKSSLLNALVRQQIAIVSDTPGTTTDPVEKSMELLPIGPVVLIDTAGLDDVGDLGKLRIEKTWQVLNKTDIAMLVCPAGEWTEFEQQLLEKLQERKLPIIVVFNKSDLAQPDEQLVAKLISQKVAVLTMSAQEPTASNLLCKALIANIPEERLESPAIIGDIVPKGEVAILVVPIDFEAPKGRIILPQVQTIRDLLDHNSSCMVVKTPFLADALNNLKRPPALVITDSQAFKEVQKIVPLEIPLTSFSIAFARLKGNLTTFVNSAKTIASLTSSDKVLIMESCTHHPQQDDIGREKIPRWLRQYVGAELTIDNFQGQQFPENLSEYKLVIHCGSCMHNRQAMLARIQQCTQAGVPITNYGIAIAFMLDILDRTLQPFNK